MKHIIKLFAITLLFVACKNQADAQVKKQVTSNDTNLIKILDSNNDGNLNPHEAMNVLLQFKKENKGNAISIEKFKEIATSLAQVKEQATSKDANHIKILDANNDGNLNPYEALDVLLQFKKENKGNDISIEKFKEIATSLAQEQEQEIKEMFNELDANKDGKIQFTEIDKEDGFMMTIAKQVDANSDKLVTLEEMKNLDFSALALSDEEAIKAEIEEIFNQYGGKTIALAKVDKRDISRFTEWDENRDGTITREEAFNYMLADNSPVEFKVNGTTAYMKGVITSEISSKVLQLVSEHPEVTTIELLTVPGSIDDDANMRACHYVYDFGLTTKLNSRSSVASGGTDFFLSGKKRIVEKGATLGVHSWGGNGVPAIEVPKDDPVHKKYLELYEKTGIPASFYWYTLKAAPADDIHIMTEEEIKKYKVATE